MFYQNCNYHDPGGRVFCARVWPYKSYSENTFFKRHTNRCRSFECFCIVNRVNNAPMTRRIPQVNMVHFQIRRFVLIDWLPTDILLKTKSICL